MLDPPELRLLPSRESRVNEPPVRCSTFAEAVQSSVDPPERAVLEVAMVDIVSVM